MTDRIGRVEMHIANERNRARNFAYFSDFSFLYVHLGLDDAGI